MPSYSYHCNNCGHDFDLVLRMSEYKKPCSEECPECSAKLVELVLTAGAGFVKSTGSSAIKPPDGFKSVLKEIHKNAGKHSKINV